MAATSSERVAAAIEESIAVQQQVLSGLLDEIVTAADWVTATFRAGGKLLLCGNGGSAADCQHLAAEFVGRFEQEGQPLPAVALTVDTSSLTALGNDYGFERIFARQLEALGHAGDLLLALSTSGASPNVIAAVESARNSGMRTIALTGEDGGPVAALSDLALRVPSTRTARIQEAHITIGHAICEVVETELRP